MGRPSRRGQTAANLPWTVGDLALEVEVTHGDKTLERYAEEVGVGYRAMRDYRRVSKLFEIGTRMPSLSWAHHQILASRDDRFEWLMRAEDAGPLTRPAKGREEQKGGPMANAFNKCFEESERLIDLIDDKKINSETVVLLAIRAELRALTLAIRFTAKNS